MFDRQRRRIGLLHETALPIARHHPVARHDQRPGIGSARLADGTRSRADLPCQLTISEYLPARNR